MPIIKGRKDNNFGQRTPTSKFIIFINSMFIIPKEKKGTQKGLRVNTSLLQEIYKGLFSPSME